MSTPTNVSRAAEGSAARVNNHFYSLALNELELAQRASEPPIVQGHYHRATDFLERAYSDGTNDQAE